MNNFAFRSVPEVIIAGGAATRLGELLNDRFDLKRVCVVTDAFLHSSGLLDKAFASLKASGWSVQVIDDVIADPPERVVLDAVNQARKADAQIVVGIGGGSSMDVAKLIAVLCKSEQSLGEMYGVGNVRGSRLPLVQIPTTAGTGSEVTPIAIITTGETTKAGVVSPQLYADVAILDVELTLDLPPQVTAATGIDAMVHAIEAYTSKLRKNPMSDLMAREALRLLSTHLLPAFEDGQNRQAREGMLLGAMLAGQAFANAPVAAVHALAYPIGGIFHVAHGLSNALVLPHVLRFNALAAAPMYAELAPIFAPQCTGSDEAKTEALIERLEQLANATGIATHLAQVGIAAEDLRDLSREAMKQSRLLINNPREMTEDDAYRIYQAAL